jgi:hypothetical protein
VVEDENNEAHDESPAQQEVNQREERHCQQNLGVKLSDHRHLALVAAIQILYFAHMNLLQGALAAIFQLLIAKGDVLWSHRHQLHGESKHHDDDQNAYNT